MTELISFVLPDAIRPIKYELTLEPNLKEFTFIGQEIVDIYVSQKTSNIVLNSAEIDIKSAEVIFSDKSILKPSEIYLSKDQETANLAFESDLPKGNAKLSLEFTGQLNERLQGFYRSRYIDSNGSEQFLATTQFEATDARRAFPCWDEPSSKAIFKLNLIVPKNLAAVSNMPVHKISEMSSETKLVEFEESPVMSTYLLAFIVGDLKYIEKKSENGTRVRVWATSGKEEQGKFALDVSVKLLSYFNDYFGIDYPLKKMDHLAIPDFAAGAMENWGAITYRETALLVDPKNSSSITKQYVAAVVAHEMAHMWFGDLVTMAWWNDLWLNESFASFIGDKAIDQLFPEWEMWTQFVSSDTNRGLSLDGLTNSHPIEQDVTDPSEIGQLFDAISYSKGGSVLRMLESYLGEEVFRRGLQKYIYKHQYSNAKTRDLWDALEEASNIPVSEIMETWTSQTGYPVVTISTKRSDNEITISASQTRFLYEHILDSGCPDDSIWQVPLSARTESPPSYTSELINEVNGKLTLKSSESNDAWVKVNPNQTGFYRVNYSSEDLFRLKTGISNLQIPAIDRLGIQNDTYALTRAGYKSPVEFLNIAEAYSNETDATVWSDLASNLSGFQALLEDEPFYNKFEAFGRHLFAKVAKKIGWVKQDHEGHMTALLRSTVLSELGQYGDKETIQTAASLFNKYEDDPESIDPDIRRVVFQLSASEGGERLYNTMWEILMNTNLEEEKVRLRSALANFKDPKFLQTTLERSLDSSYVRSQDTVRVVSSVASNRIGRDLAWEFTKNNWSEFERRYSEGKWALMQLVSITSRFSSSEHLNDVESFFESHPARGAERTVLQNIERIRINIAWLKKNRSQIEKWANEIKTC